MPLKGKCDRSTFKASPLVKGEIPGVWYFCLIAYLLTYSPTAYCESELGRDTLIIQRRERFDINIMTQRGDYVFFSRQSENVPPV